MFRVLARRAAVIGAVGGAYYAYDYHWRYQRLHRNVRTFIVALQVLADYKVRLECVEALKRAIAVLTRHACHVSVPTE